MFSGKAEAMCVQDSETWNGLIFKSSLFCPIRQVTFRVVFGTNNKMELVDQADQSSTS
jgi:hypothetical protein